MSIWIKHCSPPVWRRTPKETHVRTVFLEITEKVKFCPTCGVYRPVIDFYLDSESEESNKDQLRNMCVGCWGLYNGRVNPKKEVEFSGITIDEFL